MPRRCSLFEARDEGAEILGGDGDLAVAGGGVEGDGVAPAGLAHAGGDERAGAHLAGDALRAHVEADRAADGAGIGYGDDVAVGLAIEEEADFGIGSFAVGRVGDVDGVAVEGGLAGFVGDFGGGDGDLVADEGDGGGGREGGGRLGVDELGGGEEDEEERGCDDGGHPEALAAGGPGSFSGLGRGLCLPGNPGLRCETWGTRSCGGGGGAAALLHEDHEAGKGEHGDEEEEVVADDGADVTHFCLRGGQDTVFGELVEAGDEELEGDEIEDDGGDAEEALQVDFDRAANEQDAENDRDGDAQNGAREAHNLCRVQRDGRQDKDRLNTFAQDEQEDEEEEASGVGFFERLGDFSFDFTLHGFGCLVHEPDHGNDEGGGGEHDPAFEDIGIEVGASDDDGAEDRGRDGRAERPEDRAFELRAANFGQVGEDDADDERGFDALAEGDDECLEHELDDLCGTAAGAVRRRFKCIAD